LKTQILLTVEHSKEVPDLVDKVAGLVAYTIYGVEDVQAKLMEGPAMIVLDVKEMRDEL
jgi:hypothetical protein